MPGMPTYAQASEDPLTSFDTLKPRSPYSSTSNISSTPPNQIVYSGDKSGSETKVMCLSATARVRPAYHTLEA